MTDLSRRTFLRRAAIAAPSLAGLVACSDPHALEPLTDGPPSLAFGGWGGRPGYGDLKVYEEYPQISLPPGFHARLLSTTGDVMSDGNVTGNALDGMGAFAAGGSRVRLVRNHAAELKRDFVSLAGTYVNCAGGETPWGSWITCEETVAGTGAGWAKNHGYNFEIPAAADGIVDPVPLRDMGRFVHEAVAVDPDTGIVYQTEDRNPSGLYRFIPLVPRQLDRGGTLEMLAVRGKPQYDTRRGQIVGVSLECEWVPIESPDTDEPSISSGFVFNQGFALGGGQFARLEGCWWGDGGVYFNATSGGDAGAGQVFKFTPDGINGGELTLVFESPGTAVLNSPDNICISPRGGIVICEDGSGTCYVRGITRNGQVFDLVRNNVNTAEWAGACFSPQGRTLFVNIQGSTDSASSTLGQTFAIWGPWESGPL